MSDTMSIYQVTPEEAEEAARQFRKRYPYLYGDAVIPEPKRGGTFLYCRVFVEREMPKFDRLGRKTRYTERKQVACGSRFRILKRYRRHWRKFHAAP